MSSLILYTSPRACSTGCHIALEESGLDYEARVTRIRKGEHLTDEYRAINPMCTIPALETAGEVLTEAHAILSLTADLSEIDLLPKTSALQRARAHEWMNFLSSAAHMAFRRLFKPHIFLGDADLHGQLLELAVPNLRANVAEIDRRLAGRTWALGDNFSVVDCYLIVFWIWYQRDDIRPHLQDLDNWPTHAKRVLDRPATWRCMEREGITPENIRDP